MSATDKAYKNARRLRRQLSLPEKLLWVRFQQAKLRIRRQHPIDHYVLDFYYPGKKLAIEVDGMSHDMGDRPQRDERRTTWLAHKGIEILRIPAKDALADPDTIADALIRLCATKPLHRSASPSGPPPHDFVAGRS